MIEVTAPTRFLSVLDFGPAELTSCLSLAAEMKQAPSPAAASGGTR